MGKKARIRKQRAAAATVKNPAMETRDVYVSATGAAYRKWKDGSVRRLGGAEEIEAARKYKQQYPHLQTR